MKEAPSFEGASLLSFWGNVGIRLAELLPYSPVTGSGSGGIVPWNILIKEAINGFELGCALSLHDSSLGKSILEWDNTSIDPFWGEIPENWGSVYELIIQDLHRRISACGTDGPSYKNMFPESGPELTQTAATKVIARKLPGHSDARCQSYTRYLDAGTRSQSENYQRTLRTRQRGYDLRPLRPC